MHSRLELILDALKSLNLDKFTQKRKKQWRNRLETELNKQKKLRSNNFSLFSDDVIDDVKDEGDSEVAVGREMIEEAEELMDKLA